MAEDPRRAGQVVIATVSVALLPGCLAAPWLLTHNHVVAGVVLLRFFSAVCHQRPERSFFLWGAPLAVCVRCLGVYLGAFLGGLGGASWGVFSGASLGGAPEFFLGFRSSLAVRILVLALALNGVDVFAEFAGLHGNLPWMRLALGILLGLAVTSVLTSEAGPVGDRRVPAENTGTQLAR